MVRRRATRSGGPGSPRASCGANAPVSATRSRA
jgi:hypothetical protein